MLFVPFHENRSDMHTTRAMTDIQSVNWESVELVELQFNNQAQACHERKQL